MIKRFFASLALLILPVVMMAPVAQAQVDISTDVCSAENFTGERPAICEDIDAGETNNPLYGRDGVLTRAINVLSIVVGVIAVIVVLIAGIKLVLSQGDGQKISTARNQIIYALVGVAVAILAQAIVQFVLNKL